MNGIRAWQRCGTLALGCALLVVLLSSSKAADEPTLDDPLPLHRVLVQPDRLPAEMERAKAGLLKLIPRTEFEKLVQRAAQASKALKSPCRLVEAHYRARLEGAALVDGSGEWQIVNPGSVAGLLPLSPLSLALQKAEWQDKQDAILGDVDGKGLTLLVEQPGQRSLNLDWTARANTLPGELHFDLNFPASAVATLELDLPADYQVTVSRDVCLLTGPRPAARADHRQWHISFAGQTQVGLTVRRSTTPGRPPLVLARLQARQDLTPGQLQADFEFDLEVLHQGVRQFTLDCDPSLKPYEVLVRNLEGWEFKSGANAAAPSTLTIRLREPFQGPRLNLQVRCLAALASDRTWNSPGVRLAGAVLRHESLVLRADADVQMDDWQPGSFLLTDLATDPILAGMVERSRAEGWHVLALTAGLDSRPVPPRPSARVKTQGPEFRVRQLTWWQVGPTRTALSAQLTYDVAHGRLFQLLVQLPPGWEPDQVQLTPRNLLRTWAVLTENDRSTLVVDLQRPLAPAVLAPPQLDIRLRPSKPQPLERGWSAPFPDIVPLGPPRLREGSLAISIDPRFQGKVTLKNDAAGATQPIPAAVNGPWGETAPDHVYSFRGQAVIGALELQPRPAQVRARCSSDLVLVSGRAAVVVRLELEPVIGNPDSLELNVSAPVVGEWKWKTIQESNLVRAMERLPGPGPGGAERWRLDLARPLQQRVALEATLDLVPGADGSPLPYLAVLGSPAPLPAAAVAAALVRAEPPTDGRHWRVPLLTVPNAERLEGEVTLHLAGADLARVEPSGLQEAATSGPFSWRTFRYAKAPLALSLWGRSPETDRSREALADQVHLTVFADPGGRLLHHYQVHLWNWQQRTLPVCLPMDAKLLAARIDGRWIDHLPPVASEAPATLDGKDAQIHELPVATGGGFHLLEIIYAVPLPAWSIGTRLEAVAPSLPVRTTALRRIWRLPPGVVPVSTGSWQRLPGNVGDAEDIPGPDALLAWPLNLALGDDWEQEQRRSLTEALARVRQQPLPEDSRRLGAFLERLVGEAGAEQQLLFVDALAFRQAGLSADSPARDVIVVGLDQPPANADAQAIYLVLVPSRQGPLLTTWRQWSAWRSAGSVELIRTSLQQALALADQHGQDSSGRFFQVVPWLRAANETSGPGVAPQRVPLLPEGMGADGTEWEPLAGTREPEKLSVIRQDVPGLAGLLLAGVLAVGAVRWRKRPGQRRLLWLVGWLTAAAVGLLWLPTSLQALAWWPALMALVLGALSLLRRRARIVPPAPSSVNRPLAAGAAIAVLLALVGAARFLAHAADPEPTTIWLVPGPEGAPDQQSVLVTPEVLDQLEVMGRQGSAGLRGAVLLSAHYRGRVSGATAELTATYRAHGFGPDPTWLTLPLAGVQLQEAFVDGAPAFPRAVTVPREGIAIKIPGPGLHRIELRLAVNLQGNYEDRELRCTIPELAQSTLADLEVPGSVRYLYAHTIRGAQRVQPLAGAEGQVLKADLGRINSLHVRWRRDADGGGRQPVIQAQSASLWDLRSGSARLLSVLRYTILQGAATSLAVDLPKETEVRSVEAETSPLLGGTPGPRLRDWQITEAGPSRRLQMEFQGPIGGSVQVTLELVPRQPLGTRPVLFFPNPVGTAPGKDATATWLAYRVDGLDATLAEFSALKGIDRQSTAETFAQVFARPWLAARQENLEQPANAFWGTPGGTPFVRLNLSLPPAQVRCQQDIAWQLTRHQTEVQATAKVSSSDGGLPLVDWEIPARVAVANVSGPDVRHWSRTGTRIQVWFQKPVKQTTLILTGWLPQRGADANRFDLPMLRLPAFPIQMTTVQIAAGEGMALKPGALKNLLPQTVVQAPATHVTYRADNGPYSGTFQLVPAPAPPELSLLTFAEVRDQRFTFTATAHCPVGEPRSLVMTLRNWDGEAKLEAPPAGALQPRIIPRRTATGRIWVVELPAGLTEPYRLTLSGSMRVQPGAEVLMPEVRVEGTAPGMVPVQRWLATAGPELIAEPLAGLEHQSDPVRTLPHWRGEMERIRRAGGSVWKVLADEWRLRLRVRSHMTAGGPLQVLWAEHHAGVFDSQAIPGASSWRWLHQGTWWVYHEAGSDLVFALPAGAQVLGVAVDGVGMPPLQPEAGRLWVALTGGTGLRMVRLRWTLDAPAESLDQPNLQTPIVEGAPPAPVLWTVNLPVGQHLGSRGLGQATLAGQELRRAQAQLRLLQLLGDQAPIQPRLVGSLAAARDRFQLCCRRAEQLLPLSAAPIVDRGPDGQSLEEWLTQLRGQYQQLAKTYALDKLPAAAADADTGTENGLPEAGKVGRPESRGPLNEPLPSRGTPTWWHAAAGEEAPRLHLTSDWAVRARRDLALTALVVLLVLAWWMLAQVPRQAAWPELLALLGLLGLVLFRSNWANIFWLLPAVGLGARLMQVSQRFMAWWTQPPPAPANEGGLDVG